MFVEQKKFELALADFAKAIELESSSYLKQIYILDRIQLYRIQNNQNGIIADATELIKLNSKSTNGYFERGKSYNALKKFDLAIQDLTKAIEYYAQSEKSFLERAIAYRSLGKTDLALADEKRAAELKKQRELQYQKWVDTKNETLSGGFETS